MTNCEATAINVLVDYLTASAAPGRAREMPTGEEARRALELLAAKASKHFGAGASAMDVREHWMLPDDPADLALSCDRGLRQRAPAWEAT